MMLNCQDVSKLVSESLDHKLTLWQQAKLWLHMGVCSLCRSFRRDLLRLHEGVKEYGEAVERDEVDPDIKLSDESRGRIKQTLNSHR